MPETWKVRIVYNGASIRQMGLINDPNKTPAFTPFTPPQGGFVPSA